jgi:hypothetical protein
VVGVWKPLSTTKTPDVCIGMEMVLSEIGKEIIDTVITVVTNTTTKVFNTFTTMNLYNTHPIDIPRL